MPQRGNRSKTGYVYPAGYRRAHNRDVMALADRQAIGRHPKVRRRCLKCDRSFWSEGPHNWLCAMCNQLIERSAPDLETGQQ